MKEEKEKEERERDKKGIVVVSLAETKNLFKSSAKLEEEKKKKAEQKVENDKIPFSVTPDGKDLIRKLLEADPKKRIGCTEEGIGNHTCFIF